jgi:2-polyprenyl-6-methoxyphenol hydroxylase-like FAD-dependent oxidoreductase
MSAPPRLRVAVVGGGPAGLYVAIGAAQIGHAVTVLEHMEHPRVRGTVNRDRSYPVDVTARGMHALEKLDGALDSMSALRTRTLPFHGHGGRPASATPGLIGTRDDIVLGMVEFIEASSAGWPGSVELVHNCSGLAGIDLRAQTLRFEPSAVKIVPESAAGRFDLVVACDGKNSCIRSSAAEQDLALVVSEVHGRAGEQTYKTVNFNRCDSEQAAEDFPEGWLFGSPFSHVVARMPGGGGLGIVPVEPAEVEAGVPVGLLGRRLPAKLLPFVTAEEHQAFEERPWSNAAGGYTVGQLQAGGFVALVGDAATSPPPPGQGVNHVSLILSRPLLSALFSCVIAC